VHTENPETKQLQRDKLLTFTNILDAEEIFILETMTGSFQEIGK
jgi:hypothetical protein